MLDPKNVIKEIKEYGIFKIDNYVSKLEILDVKKEVEKVLKNIPDNGSYQFGKTGCRASGRNFGSQKQEC